VDVGLSRLLGLAGSSLTVAPSKPCGNQGFRHQNNGPVRRRYLGEGNRFDPGRKSRRDQSGVQEVSHVRRFTSKNGTQVGKSQCEMKISGMVVQEGRDFKDSQRGNRNNGQLNG
jgi:hypothetical protein